MKKLLVFLLLLFGVTYLYAVTAEQLYGAGYAYHAHTSYGLRHVKAN